MQDTFIIDGIRTAIGSFKGSLSAIRTDDLGAHVIRALLDRHPDLDPALIDDVMMGCANQAGEDNRNVARMALLLAGLPYTVPGETINRLCASGMSAVIHAHRAIQSADGDLFIAGGVENMTRGPWVISKSDQPFGANIEMHDSSFGWRFINPKMKDLYGTDAMGETAENLAEMYQISREDQDRFAFRSQQKTTASATIRAEEISPITIQRKKHDPLIIDRDEFVKSHTSIEGLAVLRPAFRGNGSVTAGNSSGLNDGACALLIASEFSVRQHNLQPIARIISSASVGVEPRIMGIGPVGASQRALKKAGLTLDEIDIIEINEAFAAQVLACIRALGIEDDDARLNVNGGAISLGHPLGMSGARIIYTAAKSLQRLQKKYALVTMCIGVGQGYAVVIENAAVK
ncbi:MAG: acetyl-CoA C-acyltransferase [Bacteroidota bacterium]|nr:acetyl-CoA C-acyltransferase [Bacteroidota bacterium]